MGVLAHDLFQQTWSLLSNNKIQKTGAGLSVKAMRPCPLLIWSVVRTKEAYEQI
jgi:hypothetical protein